MTIDKWLLLLQVMVFPVLALLVGLVGYVFKEARREVSNSVPKEFCDERHGAQASTLDRIDRKLTSLCNGGRLNGIDKKLGDVQTEIATHGVRLRQLEEK